MQHKLLRHAQLTKQIQLEIEVINAENDTTTFHQKVGFFPLVGKFALFPPDKTEWFDFGGPKKIIESAKLKDDKDYHLTVTPRAPTNIEPFKHDAVGERVSMSGAELKTCLRKILVAYQLYSTIECEKVP